jgi:hypothetical protein
VPVVIASTAQQVPHAQIAARADSAAASPMKLPRSPLGVVEKKRFSWSPRSQDDAAPEPWMPTQSHPTDDGRYDHGRCYDDGRRHYQGRRRNDDGPIRPAASVRAAVKADPATSRHQRHVRCPKLGIDGRNREGLGAEQCQG